MAHSRSAKKRIETIRKRTERNKSAKSALKTAIRRFEEAVQGEDKEQAREKLQKALVSIDKGVSKGILHKNTAARRKSRLTKKFNITTG
ncbi:MAG: 30S ribosomal protein S20 [Bacillota bacterium]